MTERITPEQIARLRQLDTERTPTTWRVVCDVYDCEILGPPAGKETLHIARFTPQYGAGRYEHYRTSSNNANFAVVAANCIIPALDEIERLTEQNTHLLSLLWKIHINNKRGLPDGVREQIESLPYVPPYQPPAEEGETP